MPNRAERRLPIGAEIQDGNGVHFRVWAPDCKVVEVVFEGQGAPGLRLEAEAGGYFAGLAADTEPGMRYQFRLDGGEPRPDPASRFQPEGPHGPSLIVDPASYHWQDGGWDGPDPDHAVFYEMHVGTFTPEGTWEAAVEHLTDLADLGISVLELMPVADFPGLRGWGYDGVDQFAPTRLYGNPDDMRRFVDRAHALGLGVILDVVYNHFGPSGNYLRDYAESYSSTKHKTEWGEPYNFDGPGSGPVREYVLANVAHWIAEYHLDGLRVDATQAVIDDSDEHILAQITRAVRRAAGTRRTLTVAENEPQEAAILRPESQGGLGFDMAWADDFHHEVIVALTGRNDFYYKDYLGTPQELLSAIKWGHLYQGQRLSRGGKRRGTPALDRQSSRYVFFLDNHDQIGNSMRGERLHQRVGPSRYRAIAALWLLSPQSPMFFQGQEYASSKSFHYFIDHEPDLSAMVREGHADFLGQFRDLGLPEIRDRLTDPADVETFRRCILDHNERDRGPHAEALALHRDLLKLRREEPSLRGDVDGAVIGPEAFVVRYFGEGGDDRLLLVNLGRALHYDPAPEPLLAPPEGKGWAVLWGSEAPEYGGTGNPEPEGDDGWRIPGQAAVLLAPRDEGPTDAAD